jgi:hypothetical protein
MIHDSLTDPTPPQLFFSTRRLSIIQKKKSNSWSDVQGMLNPKKNKNKKKTPCDV